ncbi:MAG: hypothetical protein WC444_05620 [Candidatus Paceibacterota bacterium]
MDKEDIGEEPEEQAPEIQQEEYNVRKPGRKKGSTNKGVRKVLWDNLPMNIQLEIWKMKTDGASIAKICKYVHDQYPKYTASEKSATKFFNYRKEILSTEVVNSKTYQDSIVETFSEMCKDMNVVSKLLVERAKEEAIGGKTEDLTDAAGEFLNFFKAHGDLLEKTGRPDSNLKPVNTVQELKDTVSGIKIKKINQEVKEEEPSI